MRDVLIAGGRLAGTHVGPNLGQSVFDYIEKQHARAPLFFNFMYTPDTENPVSLTLHYQFYDESSKISKSIKLFNLEFVQINRCHQSGVYTHCVPLLQPAFHRYCQYFGRGTGAHASYTVPDFSTVCIKLCTT